MSDQRYQRQTRLREFGPESQQKLLHASVLVVGVGGLGIPALQYLNAMGVGTLGLVEQDVIELSNLHRQVIFNEGEVGLSKIKVAARKLGQQNGQTRINIHDTFLVKENALDIVQHYDLVVDASDNFAARYLINDACVILDKPFVYGALHGFEGHLSVFNFQQGPTYRCLFPQMPGPAEIPNCDEQGVLGVLPGIIGTLQALEAVKIITGVGEVLSGQLMIYNGLDNKVFKIGIQANPANKKIEALAEHYTEESCDPEFEIMPAELETFVNSEKILTLVDLRTAEEFMTGHLSGSINIPLANLEADPSLINSTGPVCLICQSGIRSLKALYWLKENGYNNPVYHLRGGLNALEILNN